MAAPASDSAPKGLGFITNALSAPVAPAEAALRPLSFADFTGQAKTVERLQVMVGAAKRRGDPLNHILLSGPPGLGKTTLAFRSEEHTSELQSQSNLVCRLLLEKKNDNLCI